ncbi:MAG: hypothetical protein KDM63_03195 [Verrucomicrobiae bacterium]|nr:hypothetical protein [Verrucomicrobiae bacterium]MCB1086025.1 hypothetical protein [Verrucomicrobiae bacterium]MCB1091962.1 hypothetical protein [Verrucomicrobiae bacterium]
MCFSFPRWTASLATLVFLAQHSSAQEEKTPPAAPPDPVVEPAEPVSEEEDWLENYYLHPSPDQFVKRVREFSEDGTLANEGARPALIGFLSQVIRQNREKIAEWHGALRGLPPEEMQIVHTAMLHARISEADDILKEGIGEEEFKKAEEETPKILEMKLAQPHAIDILWGYFYATGSEAAIRRIVSCFIYEDAPENPEFAKVPEGYKPFYAELPEAAAWTLVSNATRHPKVMSILLDLDKKEDALSPTERRLLREKVFAEIAAEATEERGQ